MNSLILYLTASAGKILLSPFLLTYGIVRAIRKGELEKYWMDLAIAKDQYGNVLGQYFFNDKFISKGGYKFGKPDETISSAIGKNENGNTLKPLGRKINSLLNALDKNHSIDSIEADE